VRVGRGCNVCLGREQMGARPWAQKWSAVGSKVVSRGLKEPLGCELSEVGREPKPTSKCGPGREPNMARP
jgi:hypothetical protein